jgi:hypothetical protein
MSTSFYATNHVLEKRGKSYVLTFESTGRQTTVTLSMAKAMKLAEDIRERIERDIQKGVIG